VLCLSSVSAEEQSDQIVAARLASTCARPDVISQYQELINDPKKGDKGLTGERVLAEATVIYRKQTGEDPASVDRQARKASSSRADGGDQGCLDGRESGHINAPNVGFKASSGDLRPPGSTKKFKEKAGGQR